MSNLNKGGAIPTNSYHGLDFRGKIALNALDLNKNKLFPAEEISAYQQQYKNEIPFAQYNRYQSDKQLPKINELDTVDKQIKMKNDMIKQLEFRNK